MSRRARALAFACAAVTCAVLAASLAGRYRGDLEAQLGELRPVVVAASELAPGRVLRSGDARRALQVRDVPARFAPADALADPWEAVGSAPRGAIPPGSYVTATVLRPPRGGRRPRDEAAAGDAVEIAVAGAGALVVAGDPVGGRYDVVATGEPRTGGGGARTRLVASGVELIALEQPSAAASAGLEAPAGTWTATLAADRAQTLRLIHAHNYAREVRLITADQQEPSPPREVSWMAVP